MQTTSIEPPMEPQMPTPKVYRAHCDGFTRTFTNLEALKAWAGELRARWGCTGKPMRIAQGQRHGEVDVYAAGCPSRVIVL